MIRAFNYATILVALSVLSVPWVIAADLSPEFLNGRWVVGDQNCSSTNSEYIEFNTNGTFEGTRIGKAETVGFWSLKDGIIWLHMVTSPAFYGDINNELAGFEGIYSYFNAKMIIFNVKDKSFEAFGTIGDEIQRTSAVRCP